MPRNVDGHTRTAAQDTQAKEQMWLPVKSLRVDPTYQRPLDNQRVRRMAKEFDLDALGTIEVSRRNDGQLFVIDGQHRISALFVIGFGEEKVPCLIHYGLSLEEEARIFRMRNTAVRPNSFAMFRAELAEGGNEAVDIEQTVRRCGLEITQGANRGTIQAVSALRRVYRNTGGLVLERTLRLIISAWGTQSFNFQADLLVALALVQKRYGVELDRDRLIHQLGTVTANSLLAQARATKVNITASSGSLWAQALPELIVALYNKNLRVKRLPDWERRTNVREVWR